MRRTRWIWRLLVALVGLRAAASRAAIVVEGIADQVVVADRASFRIVTEPGFDYAAALDAQPVALDRWVEVEEPRFYELLVERVPLLGGATEQARVRFIVRASERGNSEWGLPPWTPPRRVASAPAGFAGGTLVVVVPARWPAGSPIPVVAWVQDAAGRRVPRNGAVLGGEPAQSRIELRRGIGSGLMPAAAAAAGTVDWPFALGELRADRQIEVVEDLSPQLVSGVLADSAVWPEDAWVHIAADLEIAAGAELTIRRGARVTLGPGVTMTVRGALRIEGDLERPVVFAPAEPDAWWGGMLLLGNGAELTASGAIFTGSGADPDWFSGSGYSSHRQEQAFCLLDAGASAHLTDSFVIDNRGQAFHGRNASLTLERCLVQRCQTTGQFNGGSVSISGSALIEFPLDDPSFVDADNDGIYLTTGEHALTDTLIGWAKDDGLDAGSGGAGRVTVRGCWIESCFHEGMAWSGTGRVAEVRDCVVLNCGQGVEAGYGNPDVTVEHCLLLNNAVGARYGDNYDWSYSGFLRVRDSLVLFNGRDVWGRDWTSWEENLDRMEIAGNLMSAADALHPANAVWQPETDGPRLAEFAGDDPSGPGAGLDSASPQRELAAIARGARCWLSEPSPRAILVGYSLEASAVGSAAPLGAGGTVLFPPGRISADVPGLESVPAGIGAIRLRIGPGGGAPVTGQDRIYFVAGLDRARVLVPAGALWKYLDTGVPQETEWSGREFDDGGWAEGRAELGYGDDDERTPIEGGPADRRHPTTYFRGRFPVADPALYARLTLRLLRDDGAAVYLNGERVLRSNLSAEEITFNTFADDRTDTEDEFLTYEVDPAHLRAGENVVAVEVHQADLTSSDLSFDLELVATLRGGALRAGVWDGELVLFWPESSGHLEKAERLEDAWTPLLGARSPWTTALDPERVFFRLRD